MSVKLLANSLVVTAVVITLSYPFAAAKATANVWTLPGSERTCMNSFTEDQGITQIVGDFKSSDPGLVAIRGNELVRVSLTTGLITSLAGSCEPGFLDGDADKARFAGPGGLTIDSSQRIIIADSQNHRIRQYDPRTKQVTTIAGGDHGHADGDARSNARFSHPIGATVDPAGKIIIADWGNHRLCEFDRTTNRVVTIANPSGGMGSVDGSFGSAHLYQPHDLLVEPNGRGILFTEYCLIRRLDRVTGSVSTIAGSRCESLQWPAVDPRSHSRAGDQDGPALEAQFRQLSGLAFDRTGNLLIADTMNGRIRLLDRITNCISTLAGTMVKIDWGRRSDGPNLKASIHMPHDIVLAPDGGIFFSDESVRFIGPNDDLEEVLSSAVRLGDEAVTAKDQTELDAQRQRLTAILDTTASDRLANLHAGLATNYAIRPNYFAHLPREIVAELGNFTVLRAMRVRMALARLPKTVG